MKEYTFGGRPFLLDEPQMTLLRSNVYEDLAQNVEMYYPHKMAPLEEGGEPTTEWLPLTPDEVRTLIDNSPEALCPKIVDARNVLMAVPRCYVPLGMTILNGGMQLTQTETLLVPAEDFAFLVCQYIKADELCLEHIVSLRPALYKRLSARLPEEYGQVNFLDVDAARVRLNGFEWSGDEICEHTSEEEIPYHIVAQAEAEALEVYVEHLGEGMGEGIKVCADYDALKSLIGAAQGERIILSLQTLFHGDAVELKDFTHLLDSHNIQYEHGGRMLTTSGSGTCMAGLSALEQLRQSMEVKK